MIDHADTCELATATSGAVRCTCGAHPDLGVVWLVAPARRERCAECEEISPKHLFHCSRAPRVAPIEPQQPPAVEPPRAAKEIPVSTKPSPARTPNPNRPRCVAGCGTALRADSPSDTCANCRAKAAKATKAEPSAQASKPVPIARAARSTVGDSQATHLAALSDSDLLAEIVARVTEQARRASDRAAAAAKLDVIQRALGGVSAAA